MRTVLWCVVVLLSGALGTASEPSSPDPDVFTAECIPTLWANAPEGVSGPDVAVVRTKLRPKYTHLLLDGRPIGVGRDFVGRPGYLYLRPGRYRLEGRLQGYRTAVFEIDARPGCVFEFKHRMERIPGTPQEKGGRELAAGELQRVYEPIGPTEASAPAGSAGPRQGPDLSLRPDLDREPERLTDRAPAGLGTGASLRLQIAPQPAAVSIDGRFLASAGELGRMVEPLAVAPGTHTIEVMAPGFEPSTVELTVAAGEVGRVEVVLEPLADAQAE